MTDLAALGYERIKPLGSCVESWLRDFGVVLLYVSVRRDGAWEASVSTVLGVVVADDEFESAELAVKWGEERVHRLINEVAAHLEQKGRE